LGGPQQMVAHSLEWERAYIAARPRDAAQSELVFQLARPITSVQTREQAQRVDALQELFSHLDQSTAQRLYDRLNSRIDPLAQLFELTLHHATRTSLLTLLDATRHSNKRGTPPLSRGTTQRMLAAPESYDAAYPALIAAAASFSVPSRQQIQAELAGFQSAYKKMLADSGVSEQEFAVLVQYIRETEELNRELKRRNRPPIKLTETDLEQRILATRPQAPRFPGTVDTRGYNIGLFPRSEIAAEFAVTGVAKFVELLLTHPDLLFSLFLDFLPVIGTIKAGIEGITGKDLITGDELPAWARILGIALAAIPGARAGWKLAKFGLAAARDVASVARKALAPIAIVVAIAHKTPEEALRLLKTVAELDEAAIKAAKAETAAAGSGSLRVTQLQARAAEDLSKLLSASEISELERAAAQKSATAAGRGVPPEPAQPLPEMPEGLPVGESKGRSAGRRPKTKGKGPVNLSKAGAFKDLAGATAEEVADALNQPQLYDLYWETLRGSRKAMQQMSDLAQAIAEHVAISAAGKAKVNPTVSEALWKLQENFRGTLAEKVLAKTKYKGWIHAGALDRGFFPQIDFLAPSASAEQRVSVKTVNPYAKSFEETLSEKLPAHLEDIVSGTDRYVAAGRRPPSITLDVRIPPGAAVPGEALTETLRALVPYHLKRYIKISVEEF
jgi:hypothetical protein